jgi:toxin FitB
VTNWLLVTNVLSELRRNKPAAKSWRSSPRSRSTLYVSTVTSSRFGIELLLRIQLQDWLTHRWRPMFAERVLPVSEDVIFKWRLLVEEGRKAGHTFSQPDLFIAATALHHGLTLVSRDVGDYARAHVPLFNPWVDTEAPSG